MACYMIGYDLDRTKDYSNLIDAITTNFPTYWHHLDSTWLVRTEDSAIVIRNLLASHIQSGDRLLVARVTPEWASFGLSQSAVDWLLANMV